MVTGVVIIPAGTSAFFGAILHVTLEEVTYIDALADIVAEVSIPDISHAASGSETRISFAIDLEAQAAHIKPGCDYNVRAWVDRDGSNRISKGDLISDQSCRVLTKGYASSVTVSLKQI